MDTSLVVASRVGYKERDDDIFTGKATSVIGNRRRTAVNPGFDDNWNSWHARFNYAIPHRSIDCFFLA